MGTSDRTQRHGIFHSSSNRFDEYFHRKVNSFFSLGVIEPYQTIDCEVVWYGSTQAPLENFFTLQIFSTTESRKVSGINSTSSADSETALTLQCVAQVGKAKYKIPEKRVNFGSIPINMTSKKSFTIINEGTNHLFFQVEFILLCIFYKNFYFLARWLIQIHVLV